MNKVKAISTVIGGVILELYLGCFFIWGNIAIYIISYMYSKHETVSFASVFYVDVGLVTLMVIGY